MGLIEDVGEGPIGLDTASFIYFIEEHTTYLRLIEPLFAAVDRGELDAFTSSLTLLEVLVVPYRAGNVPLAERYEALLTGSRGIHVVDIDHAQLRSAAHLRAVLPAVRTPDAIQLSAALSAGCSTFVTNDRDLPAVRGLRILQLNEYLEPQPPPQRRRVGKRTIG